MPDHNPTPPAAGRHWAVWVVLLAAAGSFALTMGVRQFMGLFLSPINSATHLGLASISLAFACGQLCWGMTQPFAGPTADRVGAGRVPMAGVLLVALGTCITPYMTSTAGLILAIGVLSAGGAGMAGPAVLMAMGWAVGRWRMKSLLSAVYAARAISVLVFVLAPKTGPVMLAFAAMMGLTFLSTVPPTAGLVAKFFGTANMATLFGIVMLTHQVGGFLGAWLGGKVFEATGSFDLIWDIDIALALGAALIHLPIREAKVGWWRGETWRRDRRFGRRGGGAGANTRAGLDLAPIAASQPAYRRATPLR